MQPRSKQYEACKVTQTIETQRYCETQIADEEDGGGRQNGARLTPLGPNRLRSYLLK